MQVQLTFTFSVPTIKSNYELIDL